MLEEIINTISGAFQSIALTSDDVFNVLFSLAVAIIIGVVISQVYKLTHRGVNFELTFMTSLIMLAPIVAMVMFFIRGNLVLSLGLVGSLSIIRFRTPIKDTRDMIYLFWTIAVGLGAGTFNWAVVTLSSIAILIVAVIIYFIKYGGGQSQNYVLVVSGSKKINQQQILSTIDRYASESKIRSQSINNGMWEIVYELHIGKSGLPLVEMVDELDELPEISNVSLLAPQLALPA